MTKDDQSSKSLGSVGNVFAEQATIFCNEVISHARSGESGIAPPLIDFFNRIRALIAERDHPHVGRSWPLSPVSPHGAWFEDLPIEVYPRIPEEPLSSGIVELLQGEVASWSDDIETGAKGIFSTLFNVGFFDNLSESERRHCLWLGMLFLLIEPRPWYRDTVYNQNYPLHPDPEVRSMVLSLAYIDLPWPAAERFLYAATHDTDEMVFLKAFRICGRRHDERSMDHLSPIVHSPASVLEGLSNGRMFYPVGHAACNICPAQFAILGTDDPKLAKKREMELQVRLRSPLSEPVEHSRSVLVEKIESFVQPPPLKNQPADLHEMIEIPAGEFIYGVHPEEVVGEVFDWSTCTPRNHIYLPTYYIDKYPVTIEQYDTWEQSFRKLSVKEKKKFEHPGQLPGKSHRRNTSGDPRNEHDHPVVGIDWFDAWAFARFHGKELPSEAEWEKAARGQDGRRYPWGNAFRPDALRYAGETYGFEPSDLIEWAWLLSRGTSEFPEQTTSAVSAHPEGISPYSVWDMCGNCWEFTRTSFWTKEDARVPFAEFTPIELMGVREGHIVIRGGAWSSPPPLISAPYRGYDLLTDRHTEIGFRCIWRPLISQTKADAKGDK